MENWTPAAIKELRQALKLTQFELAGRLGVKETTVNRWENGAHVPREPALRGLTELDSQLMGTRIGKEMSAALKDMRQPK